MLGQNGQHGTALHFLTVDGADRHVGQRVDAVMDPALIVQDRRGIGLRTVRPRPVGNPPHHRSITANDRALAGVVHFGETGEAIRSGQKYQAAVSDEGLGAQPMLTQDSSKLLEPGGSRQYYDLLANFNAAHNKLYDLTRTGFLSY